jgi:hypothetical protein
MGFWGTLNKLVLVLGCLSLLFFLSQSALLFSVVTLICSIFIFGRIESDRNQHEALFYVRKGHYGSIFRLLRTYGKIEVVVRSLIVALATAILFSGTKESRLLTIQCLFLASVALTLLLIIVMDKRFNLRGSRWAYTKGFVIAGIIFSLLLGIFGSSVGFWETVNSFWSSWRGRIRNWDEGAEVLNVALQKIPEVIGQMLQLFLPKMIAQIIATIVSINTLYGLIILPYAMLLALFFDSEFLSSKKATAPQPLLPDQSSDVT